MPLSLRTNLMAMNASRNLATQYSALSNATRRLSSGLRVGTAADDAAGLAIRELMRADVAAMHQGVRNTNDAISAIQTADGALQVIDEKLIRMKELAEQAATGTYDSTQRLMIDSEFQAMASEIQRIATATEFNNIKLLDGSLAGVHDGSGLKSLGELKVHFGPGNDATADYYYLNIGDATLRGLRLTGVLPILSEVFPSGGGHMYTENFFHLTVPAIIPKGTKNLQLHLESWGTNASLELFSASGSHIVGTTLGGTDWGWGHPEISDSQSANKWLITEDYGFDPGATYDGSSLNGFGGNFSYTPGTAGNSFTYNGMIIGYSGDSGFTGHEYLTIDEVTEDLIIVVPQGFFSLEGTWDFMPDDVGGRAMSIKTQALAQKGLERIDNAIIRKDKIRAHLGAMQNRLENTATNLQIQAENLQAAESRISDTDVAVEMTEFVRSSILAQAGVTMLAQANSLPRMALQLFQ